MEKTIKQIADELGISKTALRKYMTPAFRNDYVTERNGVLYISENGENKLKSYRKPLQTATNQFAEITTNQAETFCKPPQTATARFAETTANQIENSRKLLQTTANQFSETTANQAETFHKPPQTAANLIEQLTVKDKQIEQLMQQIESQQKTIDSLTNALASAQEAQTRLTESLAAEQALHAGTIQKQLTMQDEKPVGFWGRLFGKKKKENNDGISD